VFSRCVPVFVDQPAGKIRQPIEVVSESFVEGEFYSDFAFPQGGEHAVGCMLTKSNSRLAVLELHRPSRGM